MKDSAYELERILPFLPQRSRESIEQEVSKIIVKLIELRGPNPQHRMVAYASVGQQLMTEIDGLINNTDTQRLRELEKKYEDLKKDRECLNRDLSQEIAIRDIEIARLKDQQASLDDKLQSMSAANTNIQLELEKLLRDRIQTHQNSVELRMQGLDFKAEVDRRSGSILSSVQARMGFVPVGIEKQVELLRALKAPGDPSYDQVRQFRAMKMPTVDAESYVSGLGSSEISNIKKRYHPISQKLSQSSPLLTASTESDWVLNPSPSSPIRSKFSTPVNGPSSARSSGGGSDNRDRPSSAPTRRSSAGSPRIHTGNLLPNESPIISPGELSVPPSASLVISPGKYMSGGGGGAAAAGTDSASIVRKIRARNLDSRGVGDRESNGNSKASPVSGIGVSFNAPNGAVSKSGSPVRGTVDTKPVSTYDDKQAAVTIPTAQMNRNYSDDSSTSSVDNCFENDIKKLNLSRERRSSSGATSTGLSSGGTF